MVLSFLLFFFTFLHFFFFIREEKRQMIGLILLTLVGVALMTVGIYRLVRTDKQRVNKTLFALDITCIVVGAVCVLIVGWKVKYPTPQTLSVLDPNSPARAQRLADFAAARARMSP